MKKLSIFLVLLFIALFTACSKDDSAGTEPKDKITDSAGKLEVVINNIPYKTDKYLRIPYTLKMWEYEKEGFILERIQALDDNTKLELLKIEKADLPIIYKDPLPQNPYFTQEKLTSYYISLQIPVLLTNQKPAKIYHVFTFRDSVNHKTITMEGAVFSPRINESPLIIASPVKGKNWVFINQSSVGYHFNAMFFRDGKIYTGERFAFDNLRVKDDYSDMYTGDPRKNSSYLNYKDTLYAVAAGTVISIKDGRPENNGDAKDVPINTIDELGGNYLVLDIGGGQYAFYGHCNPHSFMVSPGAVVKEGDPLALLGNSGNSTAPHLHFEITDGPDILFSNGLPFVLKNYTRTGSLETGHLTPTNIINSMMEEPTVISFE